MENGFDVVPVRIDDERCVVPGVVLGAKTRRAIVAAAGFESSAVEPVNGGSVGCGEGHMNGSGRGFPFPDPEISSALGREPGPLRALHYRHSERLEGLLVEGAAASHVTYSQGQVVDEGKRHALYLRARSPGSIPERRPNPEVRTSDPTHPAGRGDPVIGDNGRVALQRMDNVGIVVESLDAAIAFFAELGLELEGRAMIEGDWSGRVTGLRDQRVEIAMMRMPDGHGRIELSRFLTPPPVADHRNAPVNALGYLRVMFAVDDLDDTLARLREHGAQLVDEVVQYEDVYRLCYIRGPEGILIGLAEQLG